MIEIKISAWQYLQSCNSWPTKAFKFLKLFAQKKIHFIVSYGSLAGR